MAYLTLYLLSVVAMAWYGLKIFDWLHAVRYERRRLKYEEAQAAYNKAYEDALGAYAKQPVQTYRVVLATPDRPEDKIRRQIDALTGHQEAVNYPRGS